MAYAWMPGVRRVRAGTDGGSLNGGAPRAVWLTLGTAPRKVSAQSAAHRLAGERRPPHLIWDPATGDVVQLISILRAGCALGTPELLDYCPDRVPAAPGKVNTEGRVCVQIGVLGHPTVPFTGGPLHGVGAIVSWLDSWGVPRRWPAGRPAWDGHAGRSRALWARGGHFGASQVPDCDNTGPGGIDIDRLTRTDAPPVRSPELVAIQAAATPVPVPA